MAAPQIDRAAPRAVFSELVAGALEAAPVRPSPMAGAYLVELLLERLRQPASGEEGDDHGLTLAETLLLARRDRGALRVRRLRSLGDRALFVSGFFGDSLNRSVVDLDYYGAIGRTAYADVARDLSGAAPEVGWPELFRELAEDFRQFADVLAEVGDRARRAPIDLLRLYDRCARTGSERDRRRLLRLGHVPPPRTRGFRQ